MVERLGEMRKGRRERIEKGSRYKKTVPERPLIRISRSDTVM